MIVSPPLESSPKRRIAEVWRKMGISEATLSEVKKLRQLEVENTRLRRVVADLTLDKDMLHKLLRRKL